MKCEKCGFVRSGSYEYGETYCPLFGDDDLPNWASNKEYDGCRLHYQELKKAIDLRDDAESTQLGIMGEEMGTGKRCSNEDYDYLHKVFKEYNDYIKHLEEKYKNIKE